LRAQTQIVVLRCAGLAMETGTIGVPPHVKILREAPGGRYSRWCHTTVFAVFVDGLGVRCPAFCRNGRLFLGASHGGTLKEAC